ncbi:hypothetical protein KSX_62360 [Ktedonospora formicarum]|uniref:Lipoprotein n=1 Tax=Ktedonospora formicarum TaxID=2778364 RepID=A0A8J3MVW7_9CHLR|nr:hypothetical protein KSX_62360 [Ktedonospora formicarum]
MTRGRRLLALALVAVVTLMTMGASCDGGSDSNPNACPSGKTFVPRPQGHHLCV